MPNSSSTFHTGWPAYVSAFHSTPSSDTVSAALQILTAPTVAHAFHRMKAAVPPRIRLPRSGIDRSTASYLHRPAPPSKLISRRNRRESLWGTALPCRSVGSVHDLHHRFGVAQ